MYINDLNIKNLAPEVVANLARNYNLLDYAPKLRSIISSVFTVPEIDKLSKFELHQIINHILLSKYKGESTLKSLLVKEFVNRKVTAAFEMNVNSSRVDFLTINGDTKSFEIKSELDNLSKLAKQVNDYCKVFEFNYIVIDEKHYNNAIKILPSEYGIWGFTNGKKVVLKEATQNTQLDALLQLKLFTKKELSLYYKTFNGDIQDILFNLNLEEINKTFKLMLKRRYTQRWQFLKDNKQDILPIDYQFFFNSNIAPGTIYNY